VIPLIIYTAIDNFWLWYNAWDNPCIMSVWEEIKEKLSVEDVIADYIPVKQAGGHLKCLCPFHNEKTPSLLISPHLKIWHCFGCGAGGDIFSFVSEYTNVSRGEALKVLAKKAGVELESYTASQPKTEEEIAQQTRQKTRFDQGTEVLDWTAAVYHKVLVSLLKDASNPITQYCLKRGLTAEIIQQFQIGYAPKDNFLLKLAAKYSVPHQLLVNIGVLKTRENGSVADKFSDRLMIPIHNPESHVVGFTGRVLPYDRTDRPKYLNSPQTEWFNKRRLWFGWPHAVRTINQQKKCIIVEGNMDVIAAFSHGLGYALASQGTSFSDEQVSMLKRLRADILLAFDNDSAGQIAGHKFFLHATSKGLSVKKIVIPDTYKDLDELLASGQTEPKTLPYPEFLLKQKFAALTGEDTEAQKDALEYIAESLSVVDAVTMEQYVSKLHDITGIRSETLFQLVESQKKNFMVAPLLKKADEDETQTPPERIRPELQSQQHLRVLWQKLACLYVFLGQTEDFTARLMMMFTVLQHVVPSLAGYDNFEEYLQREHDILHLIFTEEMPRKSPEVMHQMWAQIMFWLDSRVANILLNEELKDIYLLLKNAGAEGV